MKVRHLRIRNFRGIKELSWHPGPGINCLIGPGDSSKSTILDALDLLLTARRSATFSDIDFHNLVVDEPIEISATLGELDDELKNLEAYGNYLGGYDAATKTIHDEPEQGSEVTLTVVLTVGTDLEPLWTLQSLRATEATPRYLTWSDRNRLSPVKLGTHAQHHFAWRRGSVLTKLGEEAEGTSAALAEAARQAREAFGEVSGEGIDETLGVVRNTAANLGVGLNGALHAMLDAQSLSLSGGSISIHDDAGVPLSTLGTGSSRLLVAGLQRAAAEDGSSVALVDELEFGLEPHRLLRLIGSLGAKEEPATLQVFATTHSPVAIRELSHSQLKLVRRSDATHEVIDLPEDCQGTLRAHPEAFLASSILVCEGATEVGFVRGLDRRRVSRGKESLFAKGVALVDAGSCSKIYGRANPLRGLRYRIAVLRDDDAKPKAEDEQEFEAGGSVFKWRDGYAIEDEIFFSLTDAGVLALLERAIELLGPDLVLEHVRSASNGKLNIDACRAKLDGAAREALAKAANHGSWFKNVGAMEDATHDVVAPALAASANEFRQVVIALLKWLDDAR